MGEQQFGRIDRATMLQMLDQGNSTVDALVKDFVGSTVKVLQAGESADDIQMSICMALWNSEVVDEALLGGMVSKLIVDMARQQLGMTEPTLDPLPESDK